MFFASLLAMIVAGVIVLGVIIGLVVSAVSKAGSDNSENTVAKNSVLVLDMSKTIYEQGQSNSLAIFNNDDTYAPGLYDVSKALDYAKTDNDIKGILIKLAPGSNGFATMQQLRQSLQNFRTSSKFVYAYGEDITQGGYYVGSAADSVYLNPVGSMDLKGFATYLAFFKGTLEKLEVEPEIFYAGKFKSATEPFRAEKMSEPNRQQITEFQKDFWNEFVQAVSQHSKMDAANINQLAATGAIQFPEDALKYKLVDGLLYWDQVEQRIRAKSGTKEKDDIKYITINDYAQHVKNNRKQNEDRIAVLIAEGGIKSGSSDDDHEIAAKDFIKQIRKAAKNDKIKAVVLRVNSPGGSALASEVILRELQILKSKKPLIVSMGNVAASGGYYIACQADSIFAMPNTITGSIGVFSMMFNSEKLMNNKLGVTFDGVKNAPYADFPNVFRPMTEDEKKMMQASVDNIYMVFKSRVAAGRRMSVGDVDSIAQGRVWTGNAALKNGLVDGLGNLDRAIASAAAMAKLKDYQVVTYPEVTDKFENMIKKLKGKDATEEAVKMMLKEQMGADYQFVQQIKNLREMNGKAMMVLPFNFINN